MGNRRLHCQSKCEIKTAKINIHKQENCAFAVRNTDVCGLWVKNTHKWEHHLNTATIFFDSCILRYFYIDEFRWLTVFMMVLFHLTPLSDYKSCYSLCTLLYFTQQIWKFIVTSHVFKVFLDGCRLWVVYFCDLQFVGRWLQSAAGFPPPAVCAVGVQSVFTGQPGLLVAAFPHTKAALAESAHGWGFPLVLDRSQWSGNLPVNILCFGANNIAACFSF